MRAMRNAVHLCMIGLMHDNITHVKPTEGSAAWANVFARIYDPLLWTGERSGSRALRRDLLRRASGRTLEIGAGTGLNLTHYTSDVDELILAEPDAAMRSRLEKHVRRHGSRAQLIDAPAEDLPFADASIDTVVSTFVLCTVDTPDRAVREIARVLRPDGQLLFLEHVRSDSSRLARWQDRLVEPWRRFARGCRCNRATARLITSCGFVVDDMQEALWHLMPPIVRPLVLGSARMGDRDE